MEWWKLTLAEEMNAESFPSQRLAPLQRVMLRDSWMEGSAGHHVEQLEVVFLPGEWRRRVATAWEETVARTEALRIAFALPEGEACGVEAVKPGRTLHVEPAAPASWEDWLAADRCRPLLAPHEVPWRACYWPQEGRFLWTFHHALLDGRSIAAVLRAFLARVGGGETGALELSQWTGPGPAAIAVAERIFREDFPHEPLPAWRLPADDADDGPALRRLGEDFGKKLEFFAERLEITAATVLTWAWGQAAAGKPAADAVIVEQVRCGAPQPGTAGFLMNTLPVAIRRATRGTEATALREFREHLMALREIEGVCAEDFPSGSFPELDRAGTSVIMVEHGTLRQMAGGKMVKSLELHEAVGETLMATAHVLPDLRLQVEGPGRHHLLERWIEVLERLVRGDF
jgi:hypothetical protein